MSHHRDSLTGGDRADPAWPRSRRALNAIGAYRIHAARSRPRLVGAVAAGSGVGDDAT